MSDDRNSWLNENFQACPDVWLHVVIQCSATSLCWLMILQSPFSKQEVRWELKTKQSLPQQRLCKVAVPGNIKVVCASFGPLLSWGFFESRWMSGGRFGNHPSTQDEWLSAVHTAQLRLLFPFLHTEARCKTVTSLSLCTDFFSLQLYPELSGLSLTSWIHFNPPKM